ncbi:MAG: methylcobamide--CoM methyltransferase [Verrucomicrobiota bacterium]|jgi:[methyl-Co(III) methanol-specific corrinoid protein]:coenzyme M methyltransferase|nr:methylcobamide--CoM methyltransferase [Verrucomicrobiota bacterium]
MTPKARLQRVLRKEPVDRPPVCCIGGMMNAAIVDVMNRTGHTLPEAHSDGRRMADLAQDVYTHTGFENIAVPFCMTVEAELLGAEVTLGTLECEPKIVRETFSSVETVDIRDVSKLVQSGRINTVAEAARRAARDNPDIPVIASLTGPVSTAASIVDPMAFFKEMRKNPAGVARVLDYVTDLLGAFAERLIAGPDGVTAIAIGDPSATGEILGPAMFSKFAVPFINKLADRVHAAGVPFIVHICGELKNVRASLPELRADALSTDALVSLPALKADYPSITTMGNVSTFALQWNDERKIRAVTRSLIERGVDIISPACGLSTSTKLDTIRAMTNEVKGAM